MMKSGAARPGGRTRRSLTAAALCTMLASMVLPAGRAHAETQPPTSAGHVASLGCAAMAARVDATAGSGPLLLRSYDAPAGRGAPVIQPLHAAAFTYDNALAVIALLSCDKPRQAMRIGEALRMAATHDTRLRDAYLAGAVRGGQPLPNGWWDARRGRWVQAAEQYSGAYQDGSSCGNVAWTALALLALYDASGEVRWRNAAVRLAQWVVAHASDQRGAGGFNGGIESYLLHPRPALWKSTEHNIDLAALFDWLARIDAPGGDWHAQAARARHFVEAQWDAASGHFWMGTTADGVTPLHTPSALDVQLWAQLLPQAPKPWRRAIHWVEQANAVRGGFAFTDARDGMWTEGTAQAALVYRQAGAATRADPLFGSIARQVSPGGFLYASREPRIRAVYSWYRHQPCLAATAWAVLAAFNRNPYTGAS